MLTSAQFLCFASLLGVGNAFQDRDPKAMSVDALGQIKLNKVVRRVSTEASGQAENNNEEEPAEPWMSECLGHKRKKKISEPRTAPALLAATCRGPASEGTWRTAFSAMQPAQSAEVAEGARNFTVSLDDILRASTEQFPWALHRLSEKFRRLANDPAAELSITVLGNSMTAGHGTNKACDYCDKWTNRMEAHFHQQGFPNVRVKNRGKIGGSTSAYRLEEGIDYEDQIADVFIVDYSISDSPPCCGYKNVSDVTAATEEMVSMLLGLPHQPAVVYLETFTATELYGYSCKHSSDGFPQMATLQKLKVPTINYNTAVCPDRTSDPFWGKGPHPKAVPTHENVGRVAAGYFFRLLDRMCSSTENTMFIDHPAEISDPSRSKHCAVNPLLRMDANRGAENFPAQSRDASSWCFAEDVSGRPGWIAMPGQAAGNLSFALNVSHEAKLKITFLKTYENIGSIKCTVAGENEIEIKALNAHVKESYFSAFTFPFNLPVGTHELQCRSDGSKFKIVGLSACATSDNP